MGVRLLIHSRNDEIKLLDNTIYYTNIKNLICQQRLRFKVS